MVLYALSLGYSVGFCLCLPVGDGSTKRLPFNAFEGFRPVLGFCGFGRCVLARPAYLLAVRGMRVLERARGALSLSRIGLRGGRGLWGILGGLRGRLRRLLVAHASTVSLCFVSVNRGVARDVWGACTVFGSNLFIALRSMFTGVS